MRRLRAVTLVPLLLCACIDGGESDAAPRLSLQETLAGTDTTGYARAFVPRPFVFPVDHGPHPDFRTEWWYVTGNLSAEGGREFGFQFTIFRSSLAPAAPETSSAWGTNQGYMGHFALTDVAGEDFYAFERFARGAAGLAGAEAEPLRVWLEDWTIQGSGPEAFPMRLRAAEGAVSLTLSMDSEKPVTLQGDRGLSQKAAEPGNASYYYSHTRMSASGEVAIGEDTLTVSGSAWLDREWSTSALGEGQVGWDWFALQLEDGWDLMIYRLRLVDGTADPLSDGVLVSPSGERVSLVWGTDVTLEATGRWRSPIDGAEYPSGWRIQVPRRGWDLTVDPVIPDQELDLAFRYWEGAVRVSGTGEAGRPALGRGYVELTGYAGVLPTR